MRWVHVLTVAIGEVCVFNVVPQDLITLMRIPLTMSRAHLLLQDDKKLLTSEIRIAQVGHIISTQV